MRVGAPRYSTLQRTLHRDLNRIPLTDRLNRSRLDTCCRIIVEARISSCASDGAPFFRRLQICGTSRVHLAGPVGEPVDSVRCTGWIRRTEPVGWLHRSGATVDSSGRGQCWRYFWRTLKWTRCRPKASGNPGPLRETIGATRHRVPRLVLPLFFRCSVRLA